MIRSMTVLLALLAAALMQPVAAQTSGDSKPARVRGTVEKLDGQSLLVKSREGETLSIALAPNFTVMGVAARDVSDIKPGDYVASTSVKGPDGKLKAIEVHIFPESLRGVAEGQFPWDLVPDGIMTNATVVQVASAPEGRVVKVTYKGSEAEVAIPPGIPIVTYVPADPDLLKPGAAVFIVAQRKADGSLTASRVTAEKDGIKPPM
jgi:hypothetical protein